MKKSEKIISIISVIAMMATVSTAAFAATRSGMGTDRPQMIKMNKDNGKKELTDEEKATILENHKTMIDEKLANGYMTQEEYDKALADIENGNIPKLNTGKGQDMAKKELTDEEKATMLENCKTKLDEKLADGSITQEQYDKAIADIADGNIPKIGMGKDHGMVKEDLTDEEKATILENCKTKLDEKFADGSITQEQYDKAIADIADGNIPKLGMNKDGGNKGGMRKGNGQNKASVNSQAE